MALLPQNRWVNVFIDRVDIIPTAPSRFLVLESAGTRSFFIRLLSLTNPPALQTLSDFIDTSRYRQQTTVFQGTETIQYQDFSTDRYPGSDNNGYGVIYMMFTKTALSARTWTQHLNRLTINDEGMVVGSDEFDFPANSAYHILAVDQDIIRVIDRVNSTRRLTGFTFPTSGANLVRSSTHDITESKDVDGAEVSNGIQALTYTDGSARIGSVNFTPAGGVGVSTRWIQGVEVISINDDNLRSNTSSIFFNDVTRGSETLFIEGPSDRDRSDPLMEYSLAGSLLRTYSPRAPLSNNTYAAATLVATSPLTGQISFKLRATGINTIGRTVVTNASGDITDIIPQRQTLSAVALGLPNSLKTLTEWSFDYEDLTYTMESVASTENPGVYELTFSYKLSTN